MLDCPGCRGRLRLLALIEQARVVGRILRHLGRPTDGRRCTSVIWPFKWKLRPTRPSDRLGLRVPPPLRFPPLEAGVIWARAPSDKGSSITRPSRHGLNAGNPLTFVARTDDDIDGVDFQVDDAARLVRFVLEIDGVARPAEIEIGKDNVKPKGHPVIVRLR